MLFQNMKSWCTTDMESEGSCFERGLCFSLWWRTYVQNVRLRFPYRQYTNVLYFDMYLNTAYIGHISFFWHWCYFNWRTWKYFFLKWQVQNVSSDIILFGHGDFSRTLLKWSTNCIWRRDNSSHTSNLNFMKRDRITNSK